MNNTITFTVHVETGLLNRLITPKIGDNIPVIGPNSGDSESEATITNINTRPTGNPETTQVIFSCVLTKKVATRSKTQKHGDNTITLADRREAARPTFEASFPRKNKQFFGLCWEILRHKIIVGTAAPQTQDDFDRWLNDIGCTQQLRRRQKIQAHA
jgi:hypothetical protein